MLINNLANHKLKYQGHSSSSKQIFKEKRPNIDSSYYNKYFRSQSKTEKVFSSPYLTIDSDKRSTLQTFCSQKKLKGNNLINKQYSHKISEFKNPQSPRANIQWKKLQMKPRKNNSAKKLDIEYAKTQEFSHLNFFGEPPQTGRLLEHQTHNKQSYLQKKYAESLPLKSEQLKVEKKHKKIQTNFKITYSPYHTLPSEINNEEADLEFLRNLKFNQVFFCTFCYRYVFAVEKHFHYPECQEKLKIFRLDKNDLILFGVQRVKMLEQLSIYANLSKEQVRKTIKEARGSQYREREKVGKKYLGTRDIVQALKIIYSDLIYGVPPSYEDRKKQYEQKNSKISVNGGGLKFND